MNLRLLLKPSTCSSLGSILLFTRCISSTRNKIGIQIGKKPIPEILDTSRNIPKEESIEADQVVLSKNGEVVVCWHPETPFPYEMTKPIPASALPTDSALKVQALNPVREIFRKKHQKLVVSELMAITHTNKHVWFLKPGRQERFRKFNPNAEERDREYL